ncbi:uncharacterized protein BJ171DRAFT_570793 [Polychytrium aggregatum]|uniref:uncharacterized protein n=1 Tax=Polychytrium aggregatum TaxID=110093 RepID=UPI0022FEAE07|nr:uncharacterized protein BJ171DRAFT_570793 [Polychytrium aggregatum]KAI9197404.1 hypothetical protein BJ171DRAFT_570793 [Polychytrium aggregatum]
MSLHLHTDSVNLDEGFSSVVEPTSDNGEVESLHPPATPNLSTSVPSAHTQLLDIGTNSEAGASSGIQMDGSLDSVPRGLSPAPPSEAPIQASTDVERPKPPEFIHIQLIPYNPDPTKAAPSIDIIERKLKDGSILRIGRQVIRDGQATGKQGKNSEGMDVWFTSKVVSRNHAEIWSKDGLVYIKDIGSSSGTFLNKMRLSPSGKESRPYPIKEGDTIQFGIDYKGKEEGKYPSMARCSFDGHGRLWMFGIRNDIYKSVNLKLGFYDQSWIKTQRQNANPVRFRTALRQLLAATNPYATHGQHEEDAAAPTECCICIGVIGPFQALFIAPCSHCYHYKCVGQLLAQSAMFQCPLCRQVANLAASVSVESLCEIAEDGESKGPLQIATPLITTNTPVATDLNDVASPETSSKANPPALPTVANARHSLGSNTFFSKLRTGSSSADEGGDAAGTSSSRRRSSAGVCPTSPGFGKRSSKEEGSGSPDLVPKAKGHSSFGNKLNSLFGLGRHVPPPNTPPSASASISAANDASLGPPAQAAASSGLGASLQPLGTQMKHCGTAKTMSTEPAQDGHSRMASDQPQSSTSEQQGEGSSA